MMEKNGKLICKMYDHGNKIEVEFAGNIKQMLEAMRAMIQLTRATLKDDKMFTSIAISAMAIPDRMEFYCAGQERDIKD